MDSEKKKKKKKQIIKRQIDNPFFFFFDSSTSYNIVKSKTFTISLGCHGGPKVRGHFYLRAEGPRASNLRAEGRAWQWIVEKKTDNKKTDRQSFFFFDSSTSYNIVKSKTFTISLGLPPRAEGPWSLLFEGRRPEGK